MNTLVATLESGRQAARRRDWGEAWRTLDVLARQGDLSPDDLAVLADAAWWAGHPDESLAALEKAYAGYVNEGRREEGAHVACLLAYLAMRRLTLSVASGWRAKAAKLLEGLPESGSLAFLKLLELAETFTFHHDLQATFRLADETIELARRTKNVDAEGEALVFKGNALVASGRWEEGLAMIDEASASALAGGVSLRSASDIYCLTIAACRSVGDYRRAGEWTDEADRWMSENAVGGYPGVCRVHRAELKRLAGSWTEAEAEARGACEELERYRIFDGVGMAHYEVGEIRLLMGDLEGAEEAFARAFEFGTEPQPGHALLMLARGKGEAAARALTQSLARVAEGIDRQWDLLRRVRILPAQVRVSLATGNLEAARAASAELEALADDFGRPAFVAAALTTKAEIALHEGKPGDAVPDLDRAWRLWRDIGFPYDVARTRLLLARARFALGEVDVAQMELSAARSAFADLGAIPDVSLADDLSRTMTIGSRKEAPVTKTLLFTDIVTSTDLIELIGDDAWKSLLAWHDRELRAVFTDHRGIEVNHTGDGFFVSFDQPAPAVEAAVAIQRRLAQHRLEHGFAPKIRIGIHTAETLVDGTDHRGRGVHLAARVAATAGPDEIVASQESLDAAGSVGYPLSEPHEVELKGIKRPVQVRSVDWH